MSATSEPALFSEAAIDEGVSTGAGGRPAATLQSLRRSLGAVRVPHRSAEAPLALEVGAVVLAGLAGAVLLAGLSWVAVVSLATWAILVFHAGESVAGPIRMPLRPVYQHALSVVGFVAVVSATDLVPPATVPGTAAAVLGGTAASLVLRVARSRKDRPVRTMVIGDAASVARFVEQWDRNSSVEVVASCILGGRDVSDRRPGWSSWPVTRSLEDVPDAVRRLRVRMIIVAPGPQMASEQLRTLSWLLEDAPVSIGIAGVTDSIATHRISAGRLGRRSLVTLQPSKRSPWLRGAKAAGDRLLGSALLALMLPLLALLAALVRLDSRGPAFFKQQRVGLDGRVFTMYKLRTMCTDAEAQRIPLQRTRPDTVLFKMRRDPRVTRVGRFLRKSSLDELPQLLNVARGEMSLIGPRPALPEEVAKYSDLARRRLAIKPGLTGLWQVSGRSDLSWEESLDLDLHYVDNWRLCDDILIAGRTLHAVLTSKGAY